MTLASFEIRFIRVFGTTPVKVGPHLEEPRAKLAVRRAILC
jgi:hypothetical protein